MNPMSTFATPNPRPSMADALDALQEQIASVARDTFEPISTMSIGRHLLVMEDIARGEHPRLRHLVADLQRLWTIGLTFELEAPKRVAAVLAFLSNRLNAWRVVTRSEAGPGTAEKIEALYMSWRRELGALWPEYFTREIPEAPSEAAQIGEEEDELALHEYHAALRIRELPPETIEDENEQPLVLPEPDDEPDNEDEEEIEIPEAALSSLSVLVAEPGAEEIVTQWRDDFQTELATHARQMSAALRQPLKEEQAAAIAELMLGWKGLEESAGSLGLGGMAEDLQAVGNLLEAASRAGMPPAAQTFLLEVSEAWMVPATGSGRLLRRGKWAAAARELLDHLTPALADMPVDTALLNAAPPIRSDALPRQYERATYAGAEKAAEDTARPAAAADEPVEVNDLSVIRQALEQWDRSHREWAEQWPVSPGEPRALTAAREQMDAWTRRWTGLHERLFPTGDLTLKSLDELLDQAVHQAAEAEQKRASFTTAGMGHALNTNLISRLVQPLLHLVRNAVIHGIENPEARRAATKPPAGLVELRMERGNGMVSFEVRDDGRGVDLETVRIHAIAAGLLAKDAPALSMSDAQRLLLTPGFSTAREGGAPRQGMGLPSAQNALAFLGGTLTLSSNPGLGTMWRLTLPESATEG